MFRNKLTAIFPAILALPVATALSGEAQAKTITLENGESIELPQCTDNKGVNVRYQILENETFSEEGKIEATSLYSPKSGPLIVLDGDALRVSVEAVLFAAEHECAHHEENHPREIYIKEITGEYLDGDIYDYENLADCRAAKNLVAERGYDAATLRAIFNDIPFEELSPLHPATEDRIENVLSCGVFSPS